MEYSESLFYFVERGLPTEYQDTALQDWDCFLSGKASSNSFWTLSTLIELDLGQQLLEEIQQEYLSEYKKRLSILEQGDPEECYQVCHDLKAITGYLGFDKLTKSFEVSCSRIREYNAYSKELHNDISILFEESFHRLSHFNFSLFFSLKENLKSAA